MNDESVPAELLAVREKIDAIDMQLIELLSARFKLTHQVGILKAAQDLSAFDEQREADKLSRLQELCQAQRLNPELVTELFSRIMQEVVSNHEKLRQSKSQDT
ncbi:MAG: chorismate mutase [Gammaproteobacteria bacterium]|nr:chorismate mutase [Gammaproteobacteria bacterium]MCY4357279.1 chorismate mutase [Gammaproteobacteria bacterium]